MAERGQISPFDPIRRGSEGRWVPASSVKGLLPPGETPSEKPRAARIPVARKLEEPPSAGPASAGGFHIDVGADTPIAKAAPKRRRKKEAVFVAVALLVVALGTLAAFVMLSDRDAATASKSRDEAEAKGSPEGEAKREEVVIPGLDEYLGEADPKGLENADSETPSESNWTDASKSSVECGNVTVKITSAQIGRPRLIRRSSGTAAHPRHEYLSLRLELYNNDKTKKLDYASWSIRDEGVTLVDNHKNEYSIKSFANLGLEIDGQVEGGRGSLYPEEVTKDVLVFEKPAKSATFLRLGLPASAFGEEGRLKFEIPISMVAVAAEPEQDEEEVEPGEPPDLADRAAQREAEGPPGTEGSATAGDAAGSGPQQAAMKRHDHEAGRDQPAGQADHGGPIPIPGVTGEESGEEGGDFSFSDDPKLRKAREDLRKQEADRSQTEDGKEDRSSRARHRGSS